MTDSQVQEPYVLSYRRDNVEEHRRLDSQHEAIKYAIMDGRLIHASIPVTQIRSAIADLACGTGIWLDDVANTLFADSHAKGKISPMLIGFDVNGHAFNPNPGPGVQLVEHDCTKPFNTSYIGRFDLVNIRGLAYALSGQSLSRVVGNAVQLLSQTEVLILVRYVWLILLQGPVGICSGLRLRPGSSRHIQTRWRSQKQSTLSILSVRSVILFHSAAHLSAFCLGVWFCADSSTAFRISCFDSFYP